MKITKALAFSGGKDSWACLWLNERHLDEIVVLWVDTGKNFPEVLETVDLAKKMCPNFVTIKVDREGQNNYHGLPSDLVPIKFTRIGHLTNGEKPVLVQSYIHCCYENIALNINNYCKDKGITELICGQRSDEEHKSTSVDGSVVDGILRTLPIEDWSSEDVLTYLERKMSIPDNFRFTHTSMDCYDCTAYIKETVDIKEYSALKHPQLYVQYMYRKQKLDYAIQESLKDNGM